MNALTLLMTDHKLLKSLLDKADDTTERGVKTRKELLDRITSELRMHEEIEEKILYPALKEHKKAKEIVLEGYQEHHVADVLIEELHATDVSDERWGAKMAVLKEGIEHHIEEEEGDMFPKARDIFDREELDDLGARMEAMKRDRAA